MYAAPKTSAGVNRILLPESRNMNHFDTIREIGELTNKILHDALDRFARRDDAHAARLIAGDAAINQEFRSVSERLINCMVNDRHSVSTALDIIWAEKALERIVDHVRTK